MQKTYHPGFSEKESSGIGLTARTGIGIAAVGTVERNNNPKVFDLPPVWRFGMALWLLIGLAWGPPVTNFAVGAIAGALIYPVIEAVIREITDDEE